MNEQHNKDTFGCSHPGCTAHPRNGDAIYRTSPKGSPFIGKCETHYGYVPKGLGVAAIIEDHNHGRE